MAALHEIARQYADEIRDGIAWVIIWKTGRSWHAESVWLNQDSDTFELEDLSTATEILEQDPNAVMVNGYYCVLRALRREHDDRRTGGRYSLALRRRLQSPERLDGLPS